jgi:hypothetical protein
MNIKQIVKSWLLIILITLLAICSFVILSKTPFEQRFAGQFPLETKTKYFDLHYRRNSAYVAQITRFSDGFLRHLKLTFFDIEVDYPIEVVVLEDHSRFEDFVHRELHMPGPTGSGIYSYSDRVLGTYEGAGLGTFSHETLHSILSRNLPSLPTWAEEAVPTFFERFYGYQKGDDLVLFWGFQSPWRIQELGASLSQLDLREIISGREQNESKLRMAVLFLWEQGTFKRLLRLIKASDKRGYPSYFEAAMEMPLDKIIPLWRNYLSDVVRQRSKILALPSSAVFENEIDFLNFARLHGVSTKQVLQRD